LDNENLRLKNQIKDLEVMVQKEKEACDQAAQLRQKWEKGIRSLQQSNMDLTQKLKDAEAELQEKNDKIRQAQEQLECLQKMRQGVQSMLDISYQDFKEKEAVAWFTELDSPLPKVNLKFLTEYMSEFASFWEELGVSLGVDNAVREEQTQSISARQKCLHILQRWITLREASYIALLEALDKLNQRPLAKKIEMKILNGAENVKDM
jgi:septal ring factor EnvC (AmiA/AmiB activator)